MCHFIAFRFGTNLFTLAINCGLILAVTMEGEKSQITVGEESAVEEIRLKDVSESEEGFGGPKFYPPLYVQRYNYVQEQLCKHSIKSVRN